MRWGPEKTNVSDLTDEVGIAKSTFHRFFDSKAELYFEIVVQERDGFLDELTAALDELDDVETGLRTLFEIYLDWLEQSPPLQQLIIELAYVDLYREVPEELLREEIAVALDTFTPFLERWQADGDVRAVDTDTFFGLLKIVGGRLLPR